MVKGIKMKARKSEKNIIDKKNCDEGLYNYYNMNCENLKEEIDRKKICLYLKNKKSICISILAFLGLGLCGGIFGLVINNFPLICLGFSGFSLLSFAEVIQIRQYFRIKNDIKNNSLEFLYTLKENKSELSNDIKELEEEFNMNQTNMFQVRKQLEQIECQLESQSSCMSSHEELKQIEVNLYNVSFTQTESIEENKVKCKIKCLKQKFEQILNSNSSYRE